MISRSIDQLTCQCRPFRCCQAYPGDQGHHDKPSHPAARHDCLDGDTTRDLRIACADRSTCRRASQGRGPPGRQEGSTEGRSAGCRTEGAGTSATAGCGTSASGTAAATPACCGSATTSSATPAASGGCTSSPDAASPAPSGGCASAADTTSASPGCRAEGSDSASATPGGCTFAPDTAAASSAGSRARRAEATGRTYSASAATTVWHQAAAGACHHAGSECAADRRSSAWRKHDGATAASRRTGNASECGRPDNHTAGTTRRAAACRAERWHSRRSGRNAAGGCTHGSWRRSAYGTNRRAGCAERHATSRPGAKRPADCGTGLPSGAASDRTAASGPAAGRRRNQSHSRGCATIRTAAP